MGNIISNIDLFFTKIGNWFQEAITSIVEFIQFLNGIFQLIADTITEYIPTEFLAVFGILISVVIIVLVYRLLR